MKIEYILPGTWVRAKRSGGIRYVSKDSTKPGCFLDDGKVSGKFPSPYCHYNDYEILDKDPYQELFEMETELDIAYLDRFYNKRTFENNI